MPGERSAHALGCAQTEGGHPFLFRTAVYGSPHAGDWLGLRRLGSIRFGWLNQALGPTLTVGGLALVVWSVRVQYALGQGTPAPKVATQRLVTQGPYAYSRNPMTLGALLMYLGIGFWIGSGLVIILTLSVFSALLTFIYFHETRELRERFGEGYLEYKNRTPFLWPCFRMRK
jgi:protein-S-isoprenylcysteine O-methyltransferase Ste14